MLYIEIMRVYKNTIVLPSLNKIEPEKKIMIWRTIYEWPYLKITEKSIY